MSLYKLGNIKIAYFTKDRGVNFYRANQPLESLRGKGYDILKLPDISEYTPSETQINEFIETYPKLDIIFMSVPQPTTYDFVSTMKAIDNFSMFNGSKKRPLWIFDWDDDYFNVDPLNQAYKHWGTSKVDITLKDGTVLHPHADMNVEKNIARLKQLHGLMGNADGLFCTTNRLKAKHVEHTPDPMKVHVLPNAVNLSEYDYKKKVKRDDDTVRFVWTASASHINDWIAYRPILGRFFRSHPDCHLTLFGDHFGIERDIPRSQFEYIPYISDRSQYISKLCDIGADFALAPLIDNAFNWSKSPLKWEEFGALKIPVICSDVVYGDYLVSGQDAYVASIDGFYDRLCEAYYDIKNNPLRVEKLVDNAYNHIKGKYSLDVVSRLYDAEFRKILGDNLKSGCLVDVNANGGNNDR